MQTVKINCGITWVNDSKATNIGATGTALLSLENDVYWIAGGQTKGADFNQLREILAGAVEKIKSLILLGEDAEKIHAALDGLLPIHRVKTMQQAVELANQQATQGSVVLLSPACASFDMYQNYQHRGDDFIDCINSLATQGVA